MSKRKAGAQIEQLQYFEGSITLNRRKSLVTLIPCKGTLTISPSIARDAVAWCSFLANSSGLVWLSTHCDQSHASLADANCGPLIEKDSGHPLSAESFLLVDRCQPLLHELPEKKVLGCLVVRGRSGLSTGRQAAIIPAAISTSVQPMVAVVVYVRLVEL